MFRYLEPVAGEETGKPAGVVDDLAVDPGVARMLHRRLASSAAASVPGPSIQCSCSCRNTLSARAGLSKSVADFRVSGWLRPPAGRVSSMVTRSVNIQRRRSCSASTALNAALASFSARVPCAVRISTPLAVAGRTVSWADSPDRFAQPGQRGR